VPADATRRAVCDLPEESLSALARRHNDRISRRARQGHHVCKATIPRQPRWQSDKALLNRLYSR
jgi:hypothetical protein